jgi:hypothetical protein
MQVLGLPTVDNAFSFKAEFAMVPVNGYGQSTFVSDMESDSRMDLTLSRLLSYKRFDSQISGEDHAHAD